jgi:hypothetical protein
VAIDSEGPDAITLFARHVAAVLDRKTREVLNRRQAAANF